MKYLCLLVAQTGMAHLRFDLIFYLFILLLAMKKDKRYKPTGTFYSYWASRKKAQIEGGELTDTSF